ncbi:MAG: hypothetical protein AB1405_07460 [Bdellovibrionota bacterium]
MKRVEWACLVLALLMGCRGGTDTGNAADRPPEAVASIRAHFEPAAGELCLSLGPAVGPCEGGSVLDVAAIIPGVGEADLRLHATITQAEDGRLDLVVAVESLDSSIGLEGLALIAQEITGAGVEFDEFDALEGIFPGVLIGDLEPLSTGLATVSLQGVPEDDFSVLFTFTEARVRPYSQCRLLGEEKVGVPVQMDAGGSRPSQGGSLSYEWTLAGKPQESEAELEGQGLSANALTPDAEGLYQITVIVEEDGIPSREAVCLARVKSNADPVPVDLPPLEVALGVPVQLDASASYDPESGPLTYDWSFLLRPEGSAAIFGDPEAAVGEFQADAAGFFFVRLLISDGTNTVGVHTAVQVVGAPPAFSVDCFVDNRPYSAGGTPLSDCEADEAYDNPNTPANLRLGRFGDAEERDAANAIPAVHAGTMTGLDWYTSNFQTQLSYQNGVSSDFGINYQPPVEKRLVGSNKISFTGRALGASGQMPAITAEEIPWISTALAVQGAGSAEYPDGFVDVILEGGGGTNRIAVPALPADNPADEPDNALRVGDYLALGQEQGDELLNAGLYRVTGLESAPCAPSCDIFLDRSLSADAAGLTARAAWRWAAINMDVPEEGLNTYTFHATDGLGNETVTSFSVIRDTIPPIIRMGGFKADGVYGTVSPWVSIEDETLFWGGLFENGAFGNCFDASQATADNACLPVPEATFVRVVRVDTNGRDFSGDPIYFGYELFADQINTVGEDPVAVPFDISDSPADPRSNPASFNALLGASGSNAVPVLAPLLSLGTARAMRLSEDPFAVRPLTLKGDRSCEYTDPPLGASCPADDGMEYRIEAQASDQLWHSSNLVWRFSTWDFSGQRTLATAGLDGSAAVQFVPFPPLTVFVANEDGTIDSGATDPITIGLTYGSGNLSGTLAKNAVHGTAVFDDLVYDGTGLMAIAASTPAAYGTEDLFANVAPAAAGSSAKLSFGTPPIAPGVAGVEWVPFTVEILDPFDSLVSGATDCITLEQTGGSGSFSGTLTQCASGGIAVFDDIAYGEPETVSFDLTASGLLGIYGVSMALNPPVPGAASQLAFVIPPSPREQQGVVFGFFAVEVQDASGARVYSDGSTQITISLAGGSGTLGGTLTQTVNEGIAVWQDVTFDQVDTISLEAAASGLATALSGPVDVEAGLDAGIPVQFIDSNGVYGDGLGSGWPIPLDLDILGKKSALSADGRFLAYSKGDVSVGTYFLQVFAFDRLLEEGEMASVNSAEEPSAIYPLWGVNSLQPSLSANGRFVAFRSDATNLAPGAGIGIMWVYVRDLALGTTELASVTFNGWEKIPVSIESCGAPSISAEGRYVAFPSDSPNLVAGDGNGLPDIFVRDRAFGVTERASLTDAGGEAQGGLLGSTEASISADGRYVAFVSDAENLAAGDTNRRRDVFVRDRLLGETILASPAPGGADGDSYEVAIAGDGLSVAFTSSATNLVPNDTNGVPDIFVRDLLGGSTVRVSIGPSQEQADAMSRLPSVSGDGRFVAFETAATNFSAPNSRVQRRIFVRDRITGQTALVPTSAGPPTSMSGSGFAPFLSADGRYISLITTDTEAGPGVSTGLAPGIVVAPNPLYAEGP